MNRNVFEIFTFVIKTFYICIFCDVAFSKMWILIKHINENYDRIRFFHCNVCYKKFSQKKHLRKHAVIHTKNFDILFERIIIHRTSSIIFTKSYFQYLTNFIIQKNFRKFVTIYNHIFFKTSCFYCTKFLIDNDVKWINYISKIEYYFWTWLSTFFHDKIHIDN